MDPLGVAIVILMLPLLLIGPPREDNAVWFGNSCRPAVCTATLVTRPASYGFLFRAAFRKAGSSSMRCAPSDLMGECVAYSSFYSSYAARNGGVVALSSAASLVHDSPSTASSLTDRRLIVDECRWLRSLTTHCFPRLAEPDREAADAGGE